MQSLKNLWIELRSSLWFVPSIMVTAMVLLAAGLIELDVNLSKDALSAWPRLFGARAEGTRGMLSAVASATITVAGVVFSITIVALSLTSSQYTSRVLRNFMRDRTNQVVLGAFVGIYAYCLVVLRTIRGGDAEPFVPSLATFGAIVLAFVGIALLIHFIHHISSAIQAAHILAAIREDTLGPIDRLFPEELGEDEDGEQEDPEALEVLAAAQWEVVCAEATGYLQVVDSDAVLKLACEHDALLQLPHRIGDFVIAGTPLAQVERDGGIPEGLADGVRKAFTTNAQRTVEQDPAFGIRQIVDVALKALSPGVNDPTTATMCLDQLGALLVRLAGRRFPSRFRRTEGRLRVVVAAPTFSALLGCAVDEVRVAAAQQPVVLERMVDVLRVVAEATRSASRRTEVAEQIARVASSIAELHDRYVRIALGKHTSEVLEGLAREMRRGSPRHGVGRHDARRRASAT